MSRSRRRLTPAQALAVSFLAPIAFGTLLLASPLSWAAGYRVLPLDAFFTAASAVCVTGLIIVDTSHAYSHAGHLIIVLLIRAGGLGYMSARCPWGVPSWRPTIVPSAPGPPGSTRSTRALTSRPCSC